MPRLGGVVATSGLFVFAAFAGLTLSKNGTLHFAAARSLASAASPSGSASAANHTDGQSIFRDDALGDEYFWDDTLQLHLAIAGSAHGGVGPGLTPKQALAAGLKVDVDRLDQATVDAIRGGKANLDDPATTLALLKANAVVGVRAFYSGTAAAPTRTPFEQALKLDSATIRKVLHSWGPGKYDAELNQDGKAYRPDGKSAATLIPAAFGLAGVNLHTYTGWGSVTHWNAYVAVTQMHGKGTFFDPRLNDPAKYPIAQRTHFYDVRATPDLVTPKLTSLQVYQLSIEAPTPPAGSFDQTAAARGKALFTGKATCSRCHVEPLFAEPGWPMHKASEIGIDDFQAMRSPDGRYRTTPLRGLFVRTTGGFYHDGRFATLDDVVNHYDQFFKLALSAAQKHDLVEYLKSF